MMHALKSDLPPEDGDRRAAPMAPTRGQQPRRAGRRPIRRALEGAFIAIGAPLGWLLIRVASGAPLGGEIARHAALYLYMLFGTMAAFAAFGFLRGRNEKQLLRVNRRLDEMALIDALTGLRNTRYFWSRLAEEHAGQERGEAPLAIIIFDLDHFKAVNDRYGHPAGDEVLTMVGDVFQRSARHRETAARVGGEEFALLLPGQDGPKAVEAAERIRKEIQRRTIAVPEFGERIRVTVSAGVASTANGPELSPEELYGAADRALYAAKEAGRNRVVLAGGGDRSAGPG